MKLRSLPQPAACVLVMTMAGTVLSQSLPPDNRLHADKLLYADDFTHGLASWRIEMESPGKVTAQDGVLDIDVPAGATIWLRRQLDGPS